MKLKGIIFSSIVLGGLLIALAFHQPADRSQKESILIQSILSGLEKYHYQPVKIDDDFSEKGYHLYLDRIDSGRRWFTRADLDKLAIYQTQLDDEARAGSYEFFDLSIQLLDSAMVKTQQYYRDILAQPFDFTIEESLELDASKRPFAEDDAALRESWRLLLKYETLTRLHDKLESQKDTSNAELAGKTYEELEALSRQDVLKMFDDWYVRLARRKRSDHLNTYLNALTNIFDPHTGYFEPVERQNFDINMAGKLEGIGARLQTDGDLTKVSSVVVGGPAWKQGDLKENDKILKVAQGDAEPVDITGMPLDDVVQLVRGKKGTEVTLTVKKADGALKEITIMRDVVILEEGFAKSLILHTSSKEKVGYIYLPRFYDDFSDEEGRSCAEDVAKEIEKLKAESVGGVILDLRDNGGGSLRDVITMTGLFIEQGPVVQVKGRSKNPEVLSDMDPQVQWNGPLVVMVNEFSASASEIIAAALQDYQRALIVGSPTTFGKGTVQRFIDLDNAIASLQADVKPLGSVKLTTQKFYRINGGSTQLRGVSSDIVIPDSYSLLETGEKEQDFPMQWTEIQKVPYSQNAYKLRNVQALKEKSAKRVQESPVFQAIAQDAQRLKQQRDQSSYSLNLESYGAEVAKMEAENKAFDKLFDNEVVFGVQNLVADVDYINGNEGRKARNDEWVANVKKDVYLMETLQIMHDLLGSNK